jgi:hypothetical protein
MTDRPQLRLVDRRPQEPPRPLHVRLSAFASRGSPHGRSRAFRLSDEDLDLLLDLAVRLENRGADE